MILIDEGQCSDEALAKMLNDKVSNFTQSLFNFKVEVVVDPTLT